MKRIFFFILAGVFILNGEAKQVLAGDSFQEEALARRKVLLREILGDEEAERKEAISQKKAKQKDVKAKREKTLANKKAERDAVL
ncbi:MAG: hypothetical protein KJ793_01470, partial [Candidatus Omnitrophica bacterium]|nr:hypothetical protein [Candidatus Omnitrophota bacterium]